MIASRPFRFLLASLAAALLGAQAPREAELDPAVRPCQDFYQYANGGWLARAAIPADAPAWGALAQLEQDNLARLRSILEDAAQAGAPEGSLQQRVGDFYASGLDQAAIDKAGLAPLKFALGRIETLRSGRDLAVTLGRMQVEGAAPGFAFSVGQDDRRSSAAIAQFSQGGLGLGEAGAYLGLEPQAQQRRAAYQEHVARMFALMGEPARLAKAHAGVVLDLETRLAGACMGPAELRDPDAVYHRLSPAELAALAPGLDWPALFQALGLKDEPVLVRQPRFFQELAAMARELPPAQWKVYLRWQLLAANAPWLGSAFEAEAGAFAGGGQALKPRWQRVLASTDRFLGESLGRLYVDRSFPPRAKARVLELVANLRASLRERLEQLDWLGAPARAAALRKLDLLTVKVGYPEHWREDAGPQVSRASYAENVARARAYGFRRRIARLGKPVDRAAWSLGTPSAALRFNPALNELLVPAGMLQAPFFDPTAEDAQNYGAIGALIGHELIHGFDEQGRHFDGLGNRGDWWSADDLKAYDERAGRIYWLYQPLEVKPGLPLDARATLAENLADLGGLRLALAALGKARAGAAKAPERAALPAEQRFFLAYAQSRRMLVREPQAAQVPARIRVNAPLAQLPEFRAAFGCAGPAPETTPLW